MDTQPRSISVHIPLTLVALALSVFFYSQIGAADRTSETIKWQLTNIDKQLAQIKDGEKQLKELITNREELVKQSQAVQQQYTALLTDVLELSKTDEDARKIVEKWNIQRSAPPAAAAAGDQ
jgi:F0F1-type ATP synthase membrane subunit b/b'